MLLAYEYETLLLDPAHRKEVRSILEELEHDMVDATEARRRQKLLEKLRELGETRIYERLTRA